MTGKDCFNKASALCESLGGEGYKVSGGFPRVGISGCKRAFTEIFS